MDAGLNTFQLSHALSHCPITKDFFQGVYPSDYLDMIEQPPKMIVVNTDPSYKSGQHWLLFFKDGETYEMFDSLGRDITSYNNDIINFANRFATTLKYIDTRLQPEDSSLCGQYCLYFSYHRCNGESMDTIVNNMHSADWIKSCIDIMFDVPNLISDCQICEKL